MSDSPQDKESTSKPRGLWAVMGATGASDAAAPPVEVSPPTAAESESEETVEPSTDHPLRGLFAIMQQASRGESETTTLAAADSQSECLVTSTEPPSQSTASSSGETNFEVVTHEQLVQPMPPGWLKTADVYEMRFIDQDDREGRIAIACGIGSVVLSFLAFWPEAWMSVPAAVLGFIAVIRGSLLLTTQSRRRERNASVRRMAVIAILLGTGGAFLGPFFTSLARTWQIPTAPGLHVENATAVNPASDRRDTVNV